MVGGDWYPSLFSEYPSLYVSPIELSFTISLFCSNPALFTRNKPRKLTKDLLTGFFLLYLLVSLIPDYESEPLSMYPDPLSEYSTPHFSTTWSALYLYECFFKVFIRFFLFNAF